MSREATAARAKAMSLNLDRKFHLDCVSNGIEVPGLHMDQDGWFRVSYHVAGMDSAWVQQSKIRKSHPQLDTKVINVGDQPCDWKAEIWVKLKEETDV